nr:Tn3 family transposase [Mesorhizobium tianshanense]
MSELDRRAIRETEWVGIGGKRASTSRQNGLAQALRQMGRIERTLFALDWITDKDLRQTTTAELNKGAARKSLVRAVNLHRLGRFRDRSQENLSIRASALNLVVTAIIYWNTVYMRRHPRRRRSGSQPSPRQPLAARMGACKPHRQLFVGRNAVD